MSDEIPTKPWYIDQAYAEAIGRYTTTFEQLATPIKMLSGPSLITRAGAVPQVEYIGPGNRVTEPRSERPLLGCMGHLSMIVEGERWPQVRYRVFGYWEDPRLHSTRTREPAVAMLRNDGTWCDGLSSHAFAVPAECSLSQQQLSDAMCVAGITNVLPWNSPDVRLAPIPIVYGDTSTRPAQVREEWSPRKPVWRGGKPWR